MIARLSEVVHHGAATIDENLLRVGTVEIDLGHIQPPSNDTRDGKQRGMSVRAALNGTAPGDAVKI
jgi:hypothetical protein